MKKNILYPYQDYLISKIMELSMVIGRIILPTGGGKGVICRESFFRMIISPLNENNQFLGLVLTPRLLLNKQWVADFIEYFDDQNCKVNFIFVGSDKFSRPMMKKIMKILRKINGSGVHKPLSTLDYNKVKKEVEYNRSQGINTIIISTYHSNIVIRNTNLLFDFVVYDEAHYVPGREDPNGIEKEDFFSSTEIKAKKKLYTTATERLGNVDEDTLYTGRGMNNEIIYGPEIMGWEEDGLYRRISPRDLIEFGSIVEPLVHVFSTDVNLNKYNIGDVNDIQMIKTIDPLREREFEEKAKIIIKMFLEHEKAINRISASEHFQGAKVLTPFNGAAEKKGVMMFLRSMLTEEGILEFGIDSENGVDIHGRDNQRVSNKSKEDLTNSFNVLESKDRAFIGHIDILTCGIDIHNLTGVLFLQNCSRVKTIQNIGRAMRLRNEDRKKWHKGEITPRDGNWIKPNLYVILPMCLEGREDFNIQSINIVNEMRDYYGFKSFEFVHIGGWQPKPIPEGPEFGRVRDNQNLISELDRIYYQKIEDRRELNKEARQEKENAYIDDMSERGDIGEIENYIDSLLL